MIIKLAVVYLGSTVLLLGVGLKNAYKCVLKHINCDVADLIVVDYIFFIYVMTSITKKIYI